MSNSTRSRESIEPRRWTREAIRSTYQLTLPDLLFRAQSVHREHHDQCAVRMCRLLSIKTVDARRIAPIAPRAHITAPA